MCLWVNFSNQLYYLGNALVLFLFSIIIFYKDKNYLTFLILCIFANNLMDELFFNPLILGINEFLIIPISIILWKIFLKK